MPQYATSTGLNPLLLLFVRLVWGWGFFPAGWGKLGNLEQVTGFFTDLGIPAPGVQAVFVALWKRPVDYCSLWVFFPVLFRSHSS